jgi:hypothetical protein
MKIAIIISAQHAKATGGIGQFTKGISELMMANGHDVHILMDKRPKNPFIFGLLGDDLLRFRHYFYGKPERTEAPEDQHKQGIDPAKIHNFEGILEKTRDENYDIYLVNTAEAFDSISRFKTSAKVILYTHVFNQIYPDYAGKSVFTPEYVAHFNSFLYGTQTVGTQSEHNRKLLMACGVKDCMVLPMPMPERGLLTSSQNVEKSGVMYIGSHTPAKNYGAYISVMKKLKLPCKVMTTAKGKLSFIESFAKAGITDYDIRTGITGKEKVDFIKGCKVSFNTSLLESYSFAFIECVGHMPVVVLDNQIWSDNFDSQFYCKVSRKEAPDVISALYTAPYDDSALNYVTDLDNLALTAWANL